LDLEGFPGRAIDGRSVEHLFLVVALFPVWIYLFDVLSVNGLIDGFIILLSLLLPGLNALILRHTEMSRNNDRK